MHGSQGEFFAFVYESLMIPHPGPGLDTLEKVRVSSREAEGPTNRNAGPYASMAGMVPIVPE